MNNKFLPAIVCGFGGAVLMTIPGLKSFGCCLIVPAAAIMTLVLDQKINLNDSLISGKRAVLWGLKTGLFLAVFTTFFDVLLTYFVRSNDFTDSLPQSEEMLRNFNLGPVVEETMHLMHGMAREIKQTGFSLLYTFGTLFSNLVVGTIFGMLGALLGMVILNKRKTGKQ